ncbi:MAG: hypothetical protein AB7D37_10875 [Desulfovibrio sp.]
MKIIMVLAMAVVVAGCARGHWEYPGPAAEANRLAYDCQYMANMQAKGTGGAAPYIASRQYRDCMNSRGFVWIDESQNQYPKDAGRLGDEGTAVSEVNFSSETLMAVNNLSGINIDKIPRNEKIKLLATIESFNTCNKEFLNGFEENALPKPKTRTKNLVAYEANANFINKQAFDKYLILFAIGAHEKCSLHTEGDVKFIHGGSDIATVNTISGKASISVR